MNCIFKDRNLQGGSDFEYELPFQNKNPKVEMIMSKKSIFKHKNSAKVKQLRV